MSQTQSNYVVDKLKEIQYDEDGVAIRCWTCGSATEVDYEEWSGKEGKYICTPCSHGMVDAVQSEEHKNNRTKCNFCGKDVTKFGVVETKWDKEGHVVICKNCISKLKASAETHGVCNFCGDDDASVTKFRSKDGKTFICSRCKERARFLVNGG